MLYYQGCLGLFPEYSAAVRYQTVVAHSVRPRDRVCHDVVQQLEDGLCVERRRPRVELIKNAAQRPKISSVVIRLLLDQLGTHVQRGPLDRGQHKGGETHGPCKPTAT